MISSLGIYGADGKQNNLRALFHFVIFKTLGRRFICVWSGGFVAAGAMFVLTSC